MPFGDLVEALALAFTGEFVAPARHHHAVGPATHLLMPAWSSDAPAPGAWLGTKIVSVFPNNAAHKLPAVHGVYVLQSGATGAPVALMDGTRLTQLRTAAASALAARHLARADASHLLIVGAGALAPCLVRAHASQRPIRRVTVWNHRRAGAERLAEKLAAQGFAVDVATDLAAAVGVADIVSCATLATAPLILGQWLRPGVHLDLVGTFNLSMREADDACLSRARVFIDTAAALEEGGDVALALRAGAIDRSHVLGDLAALVGGAGRAAPDEITLFKSVGAAIEDLAGAVLAWRRAGLDRSAASL